VFGVELGNESHSANRELKVADSYFGRHSNDLRNVVAYIPLETVDLQLQVDLDNRSQESVAG